MVTRGGFGFVLSLGLLAVAGPVAPIRGADLLRLDGWAREGVVLAGEGRTPDLVQLVAEGEWDRSASRDPAKYAIRVDLPGGGAETRPFPVATPPLARRFAVYVPAGSMRNLRPSEAVAKVTVVDSATGAAVSNPLLVGIEDLPRFRGDPKASDPGPFGWGRPLSADSRALTNAGPDGLVFARILGNGEAPGLFVATTEATVRQVLDRLPGYDPKLGRSDEFVLEDPLQPAVNLTPAKALAYLKALTDGEASGITYRLPTKAEWALAAKGGKTTAFWWGDEPRYPQGANLLGPEPALALDTTSPSLPAAGTLRFEANPFGLYHTYGNVAEWATDPAGGFARMGGSFRTEAESPLPDVLVAQDDQVGLDPFVGVRPAFDVSPEAGAGLVMKRLADNPAFARVKAAYDPDSATVTLTGAVADTSSRRAAERLIEPLGFVACVVNSLETPGALPGQLATLGAPVGPIKIRATLDRTTLEVPLAVRWFDPLPMVGSEWYVNIYLPGGGHLAHKLVEVDAGRSTKALVVLDRGKLAELGLRDTTPFSVALSLGRPAPTVADARVVSNSVAVRAAASPK